MTKLSNSQSQRFPRRTSGQQILRKSQERTNFIKTDSKMNMSSWKYIDWLIDWRKELLSMNVLKFEWRRRLRLIGHESWEYVRGKSHKYRIVQFHCHGQKPALARHCVVVACREPLWCRFCSDWNKGGIPLELWRHLAIWPLWSILAYK